MVTVAFLILMGLLKKVSKLTGNNLPTVKHMVSFWCSGDSTATDRSVATLIFENLGISFFCMEEKVHKFAAN